MNDIYKKYLIPEADIQQNETLETYFLISKYQGKGETVKEECLICKAPLTYLKQDEMMECAICRKKEFSKTRCVEGHYVCSDCHTQGMESMCSVPSFPVPTEKTGDWKTPAEKATKRFCRPLP